MKNVRKGENAGNQYFLLFLKCFQKVLFYRGVNGQNFVDKSLTNVEVLYAITCTLKWNLSKKNLI